jgi:hypothetical protein
MIPGCHEVASLNEGRVKRFGRPLERPDVSLRFRGIVFRQQQIKARNTLELRVGVGLGYEVNAGAVAADRFHDEPILVVFEANKLSYLWCWQHLSLLKTETRTYSAYEQAATLLENSSLGGILSNTMPLNLVFSKRFDCDRSSFAERCL